MSVGRYARRSRHKGHSAMIQVSGSVRTGAGWSPGTACTEWRSHKARVRGHPTPCQYRRI